MLREKPKKRPVAKKEGESDAKAKEDAGNEKSVDESEKSVDKARYDFLNGYAKNAKKEVEESKKENTGGGGGFYDDDF